MSITLIHNHQEKNIQKKIQFFNIFPEPQLKLSHQNEIQTFNNNISEVDQFTFIEDDPLQEKFIQTIIIRSTEKINIMKEKLINIKNFINEQLKKAKYIFKPQNEVENIINQFLKEIYKMDTFSNQIQQTQINMDFFQKKDEQKYDKIMLNISQQEEAIQKTKNEITELTDLQNKQVKGYEDDMNKEISYQTDVETKLNYSINELEFIIRELEKNNKNKEDNYEFTFHENQSKQQSFILIDFSIENQEDIQQKILNQLSYLQSQDISYFTIQKQIPYYDKIYQDQLKNLKQQFQYQHIEKLSENQINNFIHSDEKQQQERNSTQSTGIQQQQQNSDQQANQQQQLQQQNMQSLPQDLSDKNKLLLIQQANQNQQQKKQFKKVQIRPISIENKNKEDIQIPQQNTEKIENDSSQNSQNPLSNKDEELQKLNKKDKKNKSSCGFFTYFRTLFRREKTKQNKKQNNKQLQSNFADDNQNLQLNSPQGNQHSNNVSINNQIENNEQNVGSQKQFEDKNNKIINFHEQSLEELVETKLLSTDSQPNKIISFFIIFNDDNDGKEEEVFKCISNFNDKLKIKKIFKNQFFNFIIIKMINGQESIEFQIKLNNQYIIKIQDIDRQLQKQLQIQLQEQKQNEEKIFKDHIEQIKYDLKKFSKQKQESYNYINEIKKKFQGRIQKKEETYLQKYGQLQQILDTQIEKLDTFKTHIQQVSTSLNKSINNLRQYSNINNQLLQIIRQVKDSIQKVIYTIINKKQNNFTIFEDLINEINVKYQELINIYA